MVQGINSVGVIGLGVMGFDIAFVYAMKDYRTLACDAVPTVMGLLPDRIRVPRES